MIPSTSEPPPTPAPMPAFAAVERPAAGAGVDVEVAVLVPLAKVGAVDVPCALVDESAEVADDKSTSEDELAAAAEDLDAAANEELDAAANEELDTEPAEELDTAANRLLRSMARVVAPGDAAESDLLHFSVSVRQQYSPSDEHAWVFEAPVHVRFAPQHTKLGSPASQQ
ncbi:hypothetical protein LTR95_017064 [Oleoguttula sp. CCFEE 5521]